MAVIPPSFTLHKNLRVDTIATREIYHRTIESDDPVVAGWDGNELVQVEPEPSSAAAKSDVRNLEAVSHRFDRLRPLRYKLACAGRTKTKEDIGLIAEEVKDLFPEFVRCDKDGNVKGVQYEKLVTVLIKEVQDLKAKVAQM